jgi:hypothetical protein
MAVQTPQTGRIRDITALLAGINANKAHQQVVTLSSDVGRFWNTTSASRCFQPMVGQFGAAF